MKRGEIWRINLDPAVGAEIRKTRPAIIVNDDAIGILPLKVDLLHERGLFHKSIKSEPEN